MSEEMAVVRAGAGTSIQRAADWSAPLTIDELVSRVQLVEEVKKRVMREGEHYGIIPGTPKPALYQPGAQKLGMTFRLHPQYTIDERDMGNGHIGYRVCCALLNNAGMMESSCWAFCSTKETKYLFRKAERICPECGKPAIIKGKPEYGGGWVCFKKKDGCGAKFKAGDPAIEDQPDGRAEHDNPADYYNTVLKMAQKRAYVGAVITATGGSELFTQDVEDDPEPFGLKPPATPPPAQATDDQVNLVKNLMKSHVLTDKEKAGIQARIDSGMSRKQASDAIEWLQATTKERKKAEHNADSGSGDLPFDHVDPRGEAEAGAGESDAPSGDRGPAGQETASTGTPVVIGADGEASLLRTAKQFGMTLETLADHTYQKYAVPPADLDPGQANEVHTWIKDHRPEPKGRKAVR